MKKELLLLSLGICALFTAQTTTITKVFNDPTIGDIVNNVIVNGTIDNSATGYPVTFNNASVTAGTPVTNTYASLSATEQSEFPAGTIKHNDGNGTTIYYKQNPTTLEIVGIANATAVIKLNTNPATAITYPTAYGNTFSDTTSGTTNYNGTALNLSGTVNSTADAYGTLVIGSQSYPNVLRLKIVINLNIQLPGIPFNAGTAQNTMYLYFDNLRKYPLVNNTSGSIVAAAAGVNETFSGSQAQNLVFLGLNNVAKKSVGIYPNPVQDVLNVKGLDAKSNVKIYSTDGRLMKNEGLENDQVNVTELQPGVYFIQTEANGEKTSSTKFIKK